MLLPSLLTVLALTGSEGAVSGPALLAQSSSRNVLYGRDVRPILSDRCFQCHGTEPGQRQAGLRLDQQASATAERDGTAAIVPGDSASSELWLRISSDDPEFVMPPPDSNRRPLSDEERDILRVWIDGGADYEEHWSFTVPERPPVPDAAPHPVDAYVRAALAVQGLEASPGLEPELALRRLFLDLTGLPPTPEELDAYLAELASGDPDAIWLRWVNRLFTEEPYRSRYAERMASPWLDQARYADTNGIHMDAGRQMWLWRDWVLAAYRDNKPFDEFVLEQIAGDQLPNATVEQRVASGFNRNHVITDEGGAISAEYLVEYAVDRADTTAQVFLGLTMGCARCHDHKFDPITQEDYYRLFDFFYSNDEPGLYTQQPNPRRAFEPALEVPTDEQRALQAALNTEREALDGALAAPSSEELAALDAFLAELPGRFGLRHAQAELVSAEAESDALLTLQDDGSALASGANPPKDSFELVLRTEATNLRIVQLDVLGHESLPEGRPGRAPNGNAVLSGLEVEVVSLRDPEQRRTLDFDWLWASHEQPNGPFNLEGVLDDDPKSGWAIEGHGPGGDRVALFGAGEAFGYEGGSEVRVRLAFQSVYTQHTFGRVRVGLAGLDESALDELPIKQGRWYHAGPFDVTAAEAYGARFGPEDDAQIDRSLAFPAGEAERGWTFQESYRDETLVSLTAGVNVHYLGKELWSPTERELEVAIGSDDGFALYLNGDEVAAREVPRGVAPDQDRVTLPLRRGRNVFVFKVVNTGGAAGFWFKALPGIERLGADVLAAFADGAALRDGGAALRESVTHAWRLTRSPAYAAGLARLASIDEELAVIQAAIPRTMVMRDREMPRQTYVLERGEYDKPNEERPVSGDIPGVFGGLGEDGQGSRLELARWMTSPDNPLVARVAVNRLWQLVFGRGLVPTSGDFGYQGAWPSHPELLDWLAVDFVESGWDVQQLLRTLVTSETYRQTAHATEAHLAADPDNVWLARFPRRRLDAERMRDQALYISGLLVEEFGGESVKPYQPDGLWREVAMLQSNTRTFERGMGTDLWRRSVYTYWKRACPPPSMLMFDAPTRESCVVERPTTNTPLQALVLWNDEQFLEAARVLAERTLREGTDDAERLTRMFRRCTGRSPSANESAALVETLEALRARYADGGDDAAALASVGESMTAEDLDASEVAAWTLVANALFNLHATITTG